MVPTTLHINIIDVGRRFRVGQGVATEQFDPHLHVNVLYVTAVSVFRIKEKNSLEKNFQNSKRIPEKKDSKVYSFPHFIRVFPVELAGVQASRRYVRHTKRTSDVH